MKMFVDLSNSENMKTVDITGYMTNRQGWKISENMEFTVRVKVPKDFHINYDSHTAAAYLKKAYQVWERTPPHTTEHSIMEIALVANRGGEVHWQVSRITDI